MKGKNRPLEREDGASVYRAYRTGFLRSVRKHLYRQRRGGNRASRKGGCDEKRVHPPGRWFGAPAPASRVGEKWPALDLKKERVRAVIDFLAAEIPEIQPHRFLKTI
jgi:hypothetical protein